MRLPVAVRRCIERILKGRTAALLYDHGHRSYVVLARCPCDEDGGRELVGVYDKRADPDDIRADFHQFERENPRRLRADARGGRVNE